MRKTTIEIPIVYKTLTATELPLHVVAEAAATTTATATIHGTLPVKIMIRKETVVEEEEDREKGMYVNYVKDQTIGCKIVLIS